MSLLWKKIRHETREVITTYERNRLTRSIRNLVNTTTPAGQAELDRWNNSAYGQQMSQAAYNFAHRNRYWP